MERGGNMSNASTAAVKAPARKSKFLKQFKKDKYLLLMLVIPFTLIVVFRILPIAGNVIAFRRFSLGGSMYGTSWQGLRYFRQFMEDPQFWVAFKNSFVLSTLGLVINFPLPIIFALLLNEIKNNFFKRFTQTFSYLPRFLSTVIVVGMMREILSLEAGVVNKFITSLGFEAIYFLNDPNWYRFIFIGSGTWQFTGINAIIYLAALTSINPELYESAEMDGAGRFKKMIHSSIPGIMPTIVYLLLLNVGALMTNGFDKPILLYTPSNSGTSDIIETYVYRMGLERNSYSYSAAVGLFGSTIAVTLLASSNAISKKLSGISFY
jgi:putative aldouronate transport system permease protein